MPQFLRPDSNVTQTNWTNGFAEIDEATASDSDFSYGNNNSSSARLEVSLSDPSATPGSGTCTVRWRYAKVNNGTLSNTGGTVTQTCGVYEGASLLASSVVTTSGSWTAGSFTFNTNLVSDWTNLRLRFTQSNSGGGGNARGSAVSWAELEIPDAAYNLTADTGAFTATGINASLLYSASLIADVAAFTLIGNDALLTKTANQNTELIADAGTFTETGIDATLLHEARLTAENGTYTANGIAATLSHAALIAAAKGTFTETGNPADLRHTVILVAEKGTYTFTGNNADLHYVQSTDINGDVGQFLVSGNGVILQKTWKLVAATRAFNVNGISANLIYSGNVVSDNHHYYQIQETDPRKLVMEGYPNNGQFVYYVNQYLRIL